MVAMRKSLSILAVFATGTLLSATALARQSAAGSNHLAPVSAVDAQMYEGMAGGYEGQAFDAGGMPGDWGPGCDGPCGGACGDCGGPACGCGNGYCYAQPTNDCCCCPADQWYVAGGFYHIQPRWKTNPAFSISEGVGGVTTTLQTDFDYDSEFAALIWGGYRLACGVGIEARAWWYDDSDSLQLVNPGTLTIDSAGPLGLSNTSTTAGDTLTFESSLEMQVVDLLFTYSGQIGCGCIDVAAGARYARIEQGYNHVETPAAGGLIDTVSSTHSFEGTGPTVALQGRMAVTRRFSLLAGVRYSLLVGSFVQDAQLIDDNVITDVRRYRNDDFRPVAELEIGAEYGLRIACTELFVQAAFVAQNWQGAGNSANNDLVVVNVNSEFSDKNADLLLWGFRTELGLRF
jgi:hypothetical protein